MWPALNLSLLAITTTLLLLGATGEHFSSCAATPMWTTLCTLSGNAFFLKENGYEAIKAAAGNAAHVYLIDVVRICTPLQCIGAFVGWLAYLVRFQPVEFDSGLMLTNKALAFGIIFLTHFAGWVLFAILLVEEPHFNALIDPAIIGSQANSKFTLGNGLVMSIIATFLELFTAASILAEMFFGETSYAYS